MCLLSQGGAKANVVNQILTELDGVESREQVYVVGSTNRIGSSHLSNLKISISLQFLCVFMVL